LAIFSNTGNIEQLSGRTIINENKKLTRGAKKKGGQSSYRCLGKVKINGEKKKRGVSCVGKNAQKNYKLKLKWAA